MDEKQFNEILKNYIDLLTKNLKGIFEPEVVSRFPQKRELIEKGIKLFGIDDEQFELLKEADINYIQNAKEILTWWHSEVTFDVRKKYQEEIKKEQWYWWLDDIVKGKYSIKMLPEYLQDEAREYKK